MRTVVGMRNTVMKIAVTNRQQVGVEFCLDQQGVCGLCFGHGMRACPCSHL